MRHGYYTARPDFISDIRLSLPSRRDRRQHKIPLLGFVSVTMALVTFQATFETLAAAPISELVVFGDSLTDAGNKHSVNAFPPSPPYFEGRHSNGLIWVDYLAEELKIPVPIASELGGTNYAWGAATTGSIPAKWNDIRNMDTQVNNFLKEHSPSPEQLFVFWGGVNDLTVGQSDTAAIAAATANQISELIAGGAEDFLVTKMPWVGANIVVQFNRDLSSALDDIRSEHSNVSIVEFNPSIWRAMEMRPNDYGLSNVTDPACADCMFGDRDSPPNPTNLVSDPDTYFMWDEVHPTTVVHRQLGHAAYRALVPLGDFDQNGVLDVLDVNLLVGEMSTGLHSVGFDVTGDKLVDQDDLHVWIKDLKNTWFGDANLDGEFESGDLTEVFKAAKYELDMEAGWAEGDWNGDGRFGTKDMIVAFQDNGYELGRRTTVRAVPEPSYANLLWIGIIGLGRLRKSR